MAISQSRSWCRFCRTHTLHARRHFSFGVGCIVTLVTGLIFLPFWLLLSLVDSFRPWRCQVCGAAYRFSLFGRERGPAPPPVVHVVINQPPPAVALPTAVPTPAAQSAPPRLLPPPPAVPSRPPFDWAGFRVRAIETAEGCYRSVVETYRGLPEWATPIVWGLGIAAPIVTMMVVIRAMF